MIISILSQSIHFWHEKWGVHFTVFIANPKCCELYEMPCVQSMTGFWSVFGVGVLGAAMKFAMKFYIGVNLKKNNRLGTRSGRFGF